MEINLSKDSVVNQRSGEVSTPSEFVENLRALETDIAAADADIVAARADLARAKDGREKLIARLRSAIRDGTVLPLLEAIEEEAPPTPEGHA